MKTYGGVDVYIHIFLTSVSGQLHAPAALPWERAPGTHFIGGWVDPRAGLDDMEKWKFLTLAGLELPTPMVVQPIASRYTDWAIPAPQRYEGHINIGCRNADWISLYHSKVHGLVILKTNMYRYLSMPQNTGNSGPWNQFRGSNMWGDIDTTFFICFYSVHRTVYNMCLRNQTLLRDLVKSIQLHQTCLSVWKFQSVHIEVRDSPNF
jgi:hypothetical protein